MGKLTLEVEGSTVGTVAEGRGVRISKEVSEQNSARILSAYAYAYRERWKNEDGTLRQPTYDEIIGAWWDGIIEGSLAFVHNHEVERAREREAQKVTKIEVG